MKNVTYIWNIFLSILSFLFGGLDSLMTTLLLVIIIDYMTGLLKAIYMKNMSSRESLKGIIKKCGYLLVVMLSVLADKLLGDNNMAIRTIVIYSFIANESLSILENWGALGLPLPKKLVNIFETLKSSNGEKTMWLKPHSLF